jgi:hypothetical protein
MRRISEGLGLPPNALSNALAGCVGLGTRILEQQYSGVDGLYRSDLETRFVVSLWERASRPGPKPWSRNDET